MDGPGALNRSARPRETVGRDRRSRRRLAVDVGQKHGILESLAADRSERVARNGQRVELRPTGERTGADRLDRLGNRQPFDDVVPCECSVADGRNAGSELDGRECRITRKDLAAELRHIVGQHQRRQAAVGERPVAYGRHAAAQRKVGELRTK